MTHQLLGIKSTGGLTILIGHPVIHTHRPDGAHAIEDLAEDDVLAVEPGSLDGGDEELQEMRVATLHWAIGTSRYCASCNPDLAAVGVLAGVGHGEPARSVVVQLEVLVGELLAVDRPAASA